MAAPAPGTPCPAFRIHAAVSGREVSPAALHGKRAVLVFHGPATTEAAKEVGKAVRARFPGPDVAVANVVSLKSMAGLWRKVAEAQIKSTYERMAAKLTLGDPADYVVICPDWEDAVAPLFGIDAAAQAPGIAVIGPDGRLLGVAQGTGLGEKAVALL